MDKPIDFDKKMLNEYIKKLNDLYVLLRKKWIKLNIHNKFSTQEYPRDRALIDYDFEAHLKGFYTVNVFSGKKITKFICFDVDDKNELMARWKVLKLIDAMNNLGIHQKYIITSFSGNKGYHVELFFSRIVSLSLARAFYDLVIDLTGLDEKVEFRPTFKQSIKVPLGWNYRNHNVMQSECCYVDPYNHFKPLARSFIFTIEKIDAKQILSIFENVVEQNSFSAIYEPIADTEYDKVNESMVPESDPYSNFEGEYYYAQDVQSLLEMEEKGIQAKGTRHKKLKILTNCYKNILHLDRYATKERLIDFMMKQNKLNYTTEWDEVLKEIDTFVQYTFDRDYKLPRYYKYNDPQFSIYDKEVERLLDVKSKNGKLILNAMLIHSKKFGNFDGKFYMTFKQMIESTGLSYSTCRRQIKKLADHGFIEISESNRMVKGTYIKEPNVYKLIGFGSIKNGKSIKIVGMEDPKVVFLNSLELLDERILKKKLSRSDYSRINRGIYFKLIS